MDWAKQVRRGAGELGRLETAVSASASSPCAPLEALEVLGKLGDILSRMRAADSGVDAPGKALSDREAGVAPSPERAREVALRVTVMEAAWAAVAVEHGNVRAGGLSVGQVHVLRWAWDGAALAACCPP
jgi:hypothetical protein